MATVMDCGSDWRSGYVSVCKGVLQNGRFKKSRNGHTLEVRDAVILLSPDAIDLPLGVGRSISTKLAAAEAIQLCAGVGLPDLTEAVAASVAQYVRDPDGTVHGNYGARVGDQLVDVVNKLRADRDSRQAIIQIWDRELDGHFRAKPPRDIPCTLSIGLSVHAHALEMSVVMRSNDVWLGLPFDVFQFRQLHRTLANILDVQLGGYCHHAMSLHAYEHDAGKIHGLSVDPDWRMTDPLPNGLWTTQAHRLPEVAASVLRGDDSIRGVMSHRWYYDRLGEAYASIVG